MERERRQCLRIKAQSLVVVSLGESKVAFLFDVSEGGLSVHGFIPENQPQFSFVAFELPESERAIVARAEISWRNFWENRSGLRFVQIREESREQLRDWLSRR